MDVGSVDADEGIVVFALLVGLVGCINVFDGIDAGETMVAAGLVVGAGVLPGAGWDKAFANVGGKEVFGVEKLAWCVEDGLFMVIGAREGAA